ncbi:hypothetical protein Q7472_05525 [Glaesserella parasuis]|uniref:hypothetical protein n=1 Tax=Glaesserella parasuis TaxID=738 RepID=UPI0027203492|nr:hypothetical protein [Glaesserella parasuis]MDO9992654.1 hypothetical protein [Glaesserella parasuis]MDP0061180.1 hypothetical protein [Glaesserella parasuis]MDP0063223.1 hypothetical protein [Glaesserella parasuis]MDP0100595.1 hypothetical protein [Glaesserella parasuis]
MLDLILSTESKVLSTNIKTFEEQANAYLATLTTTFETDDDFAKADSEVKELKEIEDKIRTAIEQTHNGEIAELISTAEQIAERFRQERLSREKVVKNRKAEIKETIISQAFQRILTIKGSHESDVSLALERNIPKDNIKKRLEEATKRRSTLATLTSAVNAEETAITAEIGAEAARISARRKLIPIHYEYLFKDWLVLIAGDDELEPIIQQRIAEEEKREAEIKAKAEQEAKAKAEEEKREAEIKAKAEQEAKAKAEAEKVQAEAKAIADEMEQQQAVEKPQDFAKTENTEPLEDFVITIRLSQTIQSHAVSIARELKGRFGDCVSLNKAK